MNIYEKLSEARLRFLASGAKKSGRNTFAKYEYFELSDILPVINRAARDLGFCCIVRFGAEEATLEVVDSSKPEDRIVFTSPMAFQSLRTGQASSAAPQECRQKNAGDFNREMQNLGSMETYVRRYLYLTAFEICESDGIDATAGQAKASPAAAKKPAPAQAAPESEMTPAEMQSEIQRVLTATLPDGKLAFTEEEKKDWWKRFTKNPKSTLSLAKMEGAKRGLSWGLDNP